MSISIKSGLVRLPALLAALSLGLSACGAATSAPGGAPVAPTLAGRSAATAAPQGSPAAAAARKEVELVKSVRPILVNTVDALKRNDVAAARTAFSAYDPAWNGIEVYVNFRSRPLYETLENEYQAKIEQALATSRPDAAEIRPLAEAMLAKYDEAIKLSETGPAISPLFDDVAALRIARAPLRTAGAALKAGDVPGATKAYGAFQQAWPNVQALLRLRSQDAYTELEQSVSGATQAFGQSAPAAAAPTPALDALLERYNFGLSLVTTAARNADLGKASYTAEDLQQSVSLATIEGHLRASLPLWESGDYAAAATQAEQAAGQRFEAVVAALRDKGADAALKKALDAYAALAGGAGERAKVRAANKSAVEAVWVAEQALVGQFWSDNKLHGSLIRGLLANLREEYGAGAQVSGAGAAGYHTAWGLLAVAERRYKTIDAKVRENAAVADTMARQFEALRAALPDPLRPPTPAAAPDAVGMATSAIAAGLESNLGLPRS